MKLHVSVAPVRQRTPFDLLLTVLFSLSAVLAIVSSSQARGQTSYTSPIDITSYRNEFRVVIPNRDTGQMMTLPLPLDSLLGPKTAQVLQTPFGETLNQYWGVTKDPATQMTMRERICNGPGGIVSRAQQAVSGMQGAFSIVGIQCNLGQQGKVLLRHIGSSYTLAFQVTNNEVDFRLATPVTCGTGHPLCPSDPHFKVTFATEISTVVNFSGDICSLHGSPAQILLPAIDISGDNLGGEAGVAAAHLLLPGKTFPSVENAIENNIVTIPLPLDNAFKELRNGETCKSSSENAQLLKSLAQFDVSLDRGVIAYTLTHPPIPAPSLQVIGTETPAQASFFHPTLSTTRPVVAAGTVFDLTGRYFPGEAVSNNSMPASFSRSETCLWKSTDLQISAAAFPHAPGTINVRTSPLPQAPSVQHLGPTANGACPVSYTAQALKADTPYAFSARDCDKVTCSPYSPTIIATTAKLNPNRHVLALTLDGSTPLGTVTLSNAGTFATNLTLPPGITAGAHTIRAANSVFAAEMSVTVPGTSVASGKGSLTLVGVLRGEVGCPAHPLTSTATGDGFMLFGTGFSPGVVGIHLDNAVGLNLGNASAAADGTFCQRMGGVPATMAGVHKLVAVQNQAVQSQTIINFVLPYVVR